MRSLLVASNRLFQTRVLPGWPPPWGQEGLGGGGGGRGGGSIHPWPSGLKAQPGFPRALASRRPLGAWQWLGTRANPAGRRPATGRRPSREEACITLLRIASRGVAAQPSKKNSSSFVLRPSSSSSSTSSSSAYMSAGSRRVARVVRRWPWMRRHSCWTGLCQSCPLHSPSSTSLSPSLLLSLTLSVYVYMCRCILYMYMYVCLYIFMHV